MALYNYMSQILVELIKLANLIITVTKSFASAARIRDVLELDTNTVYSDDKKIYNTHAVEFDRVSMHYNEGAKGRARKHQLHRRAGRDHRRYRRHRQRKNDACGAYSPLL